MKKRLKILLFVSTLVFIITMPCIVDASSIDDFISGLNSMSPDKEMLPIALFVEAFVSIHMSLFVLVPIAKIFKGEDYKNLFWSLFVIRAVFLLLMDFCVTPGICVVDFLAIFVGAFLVVPILSVIKGIPLVKALAKGSVMNTPLGVVKAEDAIEEYAIEEGVALVKDVTTGNIVYNESVEINNLFMVSENALLKRVIKEEVVNQGEKTGHLYTRGTSLVKTIIWILFTVACVASVVMYYLNYDVSYCVGVFVVAIIILLIIESIISPVKRMSKIAIKNPDSDISLLVKDYISNKTGIIPCYLFIVVIIALSIGVVFYFKTPKLLYKYMFNGYYVYNYTRTEDSLNILEIPDAYKNKPITGVSARAFINSKIKKIVLPDTVESIGYKAFYNSSIEEIVLPKSLEEIKANAFQNSLDLTHVEFNDKITSIRAYAFDNCVNLTDVTLPETVDYIGAYAFKNCYSLTKFKVPSKVTELNGGTFSGCNELASIELHDNIDSIHGEVFYGCSSLDNVVLPSKITEIRGNTFEYCSSLTSIDIPEGVKRIGGHAFYGCTKLSKAIIPSTVEEIGSSAFRQCYSLNKIKVPAGAVINERAFKESPTVINYYDGVENKYPDEINNNYSNSDSFSTTQKEEDVEDLPIVDKNSVVYKTDYIEFDEFNSINYVALDDLIFYFHSGIAHDNNSAYVSGSVTNEKEYKGFIAFRTEYYDNNHDLIGQYSDKIELLGPGYTSISFVSNLEAEYLTKTINDVEYYKIFIGQIVKTK